MRQLILPLIFVLIAFGAFSLLNLLGRGGASPPDQGQMAEQILPDREGQNPGDQDNFIEDKAEVLATEEENQHPSAGDGIQIGEDIQRPEDTPLALNPVLSDLAKEEQPTFGRVSIDGFGNVTLIHGRGVPGTQIDLLMNGEVVAETQVSVGGTWSLYESALLPHGDYELGLRTVLADGRVGVSDQVVLTRLDASRPLNQTPPALLREQAHLLRILSGPRFASTLLPQAISYDEDGIRLYGKAPVGVWIRLAGDTNLTNEVLVGANGLWALNIGPWQSDTLTLIQENLESDEAVVQIVLPIPSREEVSMDPTLSFRLGSSLIYFWEQGL